MQMLLGDIAYYCIYHFVKPNVTVDAGCILDSLYSDYSCHKYTIVSTTTLHHT